MVIFNSCKAARCYPIPMPEQQMTSVGAVPMFSIRESQHKTKTRPAPAWEVKASMESGVAYGAQLQLFINCCQG